MGIGKIEKPVFVSINQVLKGTDWRRLPAAKLSGHTSNKACHHQSRGSISMVNGIRFQSKKLRIMVTCLLYQVLQDSSLRPTILMTVFFIKQFGIIWNSLVQRGLRLRVFHLLLIRIAQHDTRKKFFRFVDQSFVLNAYVLIEQGNIQTLNRFLVHGRRSSSTRR